MIARKKILLYVCIIDLHLVATSSSNNTSTSFRPDTMECINIYETKFGIFYHLCSIYSNHRLKRALSQTHSLATERLNARRASQPWTKNHTPPTVTFPSSRRVTRNEQNENIIAVAVAIVNTHSQR